MHIWVPHSQQPPLPFRLLHIQSSHTSQTVRHPVQWGLAAFTPSIFVLHTRSRICTLRLHNQQYHCRQWRSSESRQQHALRHSRQHTDGLRSTPVQLQLAHVAERVLSSKSDLHVSHVRSCCGRAVVMLLLMRCACISMDMQICPSHMRDDNLSTCGHNPPPCLVHF
jgi:hypothetical protein